MHFELIQQRNSNDYNKNNEIIMDLKSKLLPENLDQPFQPQTQQELPTTIPIDVEQDDRNRSEHVYESSILSPFPLRAQHHSDSDTLCHSQTCSYDYQENNFAKDASLVNDRASYCTHKSKQITNNRMEETVDRRMSVDEIIMSRSQSFKAISVEEELLSTPSRKLDFGALDRARSLSVVNNRSPLLISPQLMRKSSSYAYHRSEEGSMKNIRPVMTDDGVYRTDKMKSLEQSDNQLPDNFSINSSEPTSKFGIKDYYSRDPVSCGNSKFRENSDNGESPLDEKELHKSSSPVLRPHCLPGIVPGGALLYSFPVINSNKTTANPLDPSVDSTRTILQSNSSRLTDSDSFQSSPKASYQRVLTTDGVLSVNQHQSNFSSRHLPPHHPEESLPETRSTFLSEDPFSFLGVCTRPPSNSDDRHCNEALLHIPLLGNDNMDSAATTTNYQILRQPELQPYLTRPRHFVIVEIWNGKCKRHFIQTPELLRLVHTHNKKHAIEDSLPGSLKLRDLRQICSQSLGSQRASIEMRRNCILFNLTKVRCIIMHQKLILIPQGYGNEHAHRVGLLNRSNDKTKAHDGYQALLPIQNSFEEEDDSLIKKLVQISELRTNGPFEFAVLESLLVEVCSYLSDELSCVVREADKLHDFTVGSLSSAQRLHEISDLKRTVDILSDRLKGVYGAVQELLNNEEDLRRMEVTRFWMNPEEWNNPPDTSASEDAEILLECYEQEISSMLTQINRIDEGLDDTLQMIQLHLASIRNVFLKSELGLDVVGTVVTFIGALAGIFGMNMPNGFEDNHNIFWPICQSVLGICAVTAIITVIAFRRIKL